jgi:hypothetical protein
MCGRTFADASAGNLQAEYDLLSLGECERPYGDPPKWTLEYKERVSATPVH